ncbi:hypothetical protein BcepF1.112 [Burkholderia phage BcepF1]|uniref:Uncharacterized protein n=1 Tax=Burkholderia phage BcepF1 TaxID=2886897 RepID=A1Z016_9CAUD|nr:tail completion or Neck1 protein [Burkholderia phage BcepF1]ABL96843.1 hypothetical protein BcepF1.112 [Burkholderia phage BcepF1]
MKKGFSKSNSVAAPLKHFQMLKQFDALKGKTVQAGWFETDRYPAKEGETIGPLVAKIARQLEFGGVINHPGGTKYIKDAIVDGRYVGTRFVHKSFQGEHEVTKAHQIVIPARPFMRLAWATFNKDKVKIQAQIARQLLDGTINPEQALAQIGLALEGCIVRSIKSGPWAANSPATIRAKGFDKPLIDTAHMWQTVSSKVS